MMVSDMVLRARARQLLKGFKGDSFAFGLRVSTRSVSLLRSLAKPLMKLKNVRVPLDATLVEEHMRPILLAAKTGDFSLIKNMNYVFKPTCSASFRPAPPTADYELPVHEVGVFSQCPDFLWCLERNG